jgi:hypothetical protein
MYPSTEEIRSYEINFDQIFIENKNVFKKYNGYRNNCSNTVRKFFSLLGVNTDKVTGWADTVRNLGQVIYNPMDLKKGDIVAMGKPGNTWHVGIYFGNGRVLHQSAMRGYTIGIFNDINAFINYRRGFYIVRPYSNILETQFFVSPGIS